MKVLKFGGTSVGTVDSLKNVKAIVDGNDGPLIIVVSALGGVTDMLINTGRAALESFEACSDNINTIIARHHVIIDNLVPVERRNDVKSVIDSMIDDLVNIYRGVSLIKDLSKHTLDTIVSYGERMSSFIISNILDGAVLYDSRQFIRTVCRNGKDVLDDVTTHDLIHGVFHDFGDKVAILPGFISTDAQGNITNLGRGGSDYTAAIIAANLNAEVLEIWTDVDGFMTADPRIIPNAYVIDRMSFNDAMELCNFGAKVVYPPTIYPVYHKNIPILIKNTFNPSAPGTLISSGHVPSNKPIKGISSINDTCLITITGLGMVGIIGVNARIFNSLAENGVSVFMVSQASSENNTSIAVRQSDAERAVATLSEEFAEELRRGDLSDIIAEGGLATVAIVGENMKSETGVAGRLFNTIGRNGITVKAITQGASETNISFIIDRRDLEKAISVIHDSFFLSASQVLNVFIVGVGNVGQRLLTQIAGQQHRLLEEKALKIQVVGIANSRKAVFDRNGIDVASYKELLDESTFTATPARIKDEVLGMNIYNPVFVDCTSSDQIARLYYDLLNHNVNVVAANKIATSSDYENYSMLKEIARRRDVKFLFETNVGAGLPIINTINNLRNSGDKIIKIEAVVSGTLNYIFNVVGKDTPLSRAIMMAREEGYSEPDPRIDLSGRDVVRKLVILAREAGYVVEQNDVKKHLFIPEKYFTGTIEDFFQNIVEVDSEFESMRLDAEKKKEHFRFVAKLEDGAVEVGLQRVGSRHPFYDLEGSNNVILITTERYREFPMSIKGYGAGAEVTAAGVFADIISIANIR
ncbi:MAG: bifunctional aspartate kinase/homoserine dehydrogenase I [Clostridiales bacterium]|nr:bifunctional aspartate kinase/homoserine dehydrogenase I [Clostridiales bacterium]